MNGIVIAVVVVVIIGLICSVILTIAAKKFEVPVDERVSNVRECLPGANCGACGYAGCDSYAEAVVADPSIGTSLCVPGGAAAAQGIAEVLGVAAGEVVPMVAYVKCNGTNENTEDKFQWLGDKTCKGAKLMFGSKNSCTYGCIGFGDCVGVCDNEAIDIVNGVARIYSDFCIGCAKCQKTCPNGVIDMIRKDATVRLTCNNKDKGKAAMSVCKVSCIACGKCAKTAEEAESITMDSNLPVIDSAKVTNGQAVIDSCPRKCLK